MMVGKVFAPRCMLGAVELLCVELIAGSWFDVGQILSRITGVFAFPAPPSSSDGSTQGQQSEKNGGSYSICY